jgi:hypothetical protein
VDTIPGAIALSLLKGDKIRKYWQLFAIFSLKAVEPMVILGFTGNCIEGVSSAARTGLPV